MLFVKRKAADSAAQVEPQATGSSEAGDAPEQRASPGPSGLFLENLPASGRSRKRAWPRLGAKARAPEEPAPQAQADAADERDDLASASATRRRWPWPRKRLAGRTDSARPRELPIRILMGFLPSVTAGDAAEFALGVAEKNFDQPGIAFFDAFAYKDGYVYEVHEGGEGKAYAPAVIRHFKALPEFAAGESHAVVIPTATRSVRIERTRAGLQTVLLPESSTQAPSEGLAPTVKMRPAISKRTGVLIGGAVLFVSGFFGLLFSLIARIPVYEAPPAVPVERVDYARLPSAQWQRLLLVPPERYVKALRYENGAWRIEDAPIGERDATNAQADGPPPLPELALPELALPEFARGAGASAAAPGAPASSESGAAPDARPGARP